METNSAVRPDSLTRLGSTRRNNNFLPWLLHHFDSALCVRVRDSLQLDEVKVSKEGRNTNGF